MRTIVNRAAVGYITRENIATVLRILFCGLIFWAFTVGSYSGPVNAQAAFTLAIMLSLLLTYELAIRDAPPAWVLSALFFPLVIIVGGYRAWLSLQPPPPTGPLIPAGEASPLLRCLEKPGLHDLVMTFATDAVIGKGSGPYTPIMVSDCPALSLVRRGNRLMVESFGYDGNGDIGFRVRDNVYEPMDFAEFRMLRPDPSTFVLLDQYDEEVIYVRYLNVNAVRIRGHFLCGAAPQAVIRDNRIFVGGISLRGVTLGSRPTVGHVCAVTDAHQPHGVVITSR